MAETAHKEEIKLRAMKLLRYNSEEYGDEDSYTINKVIIEAAKSIMLTVHMNGKPLKMEVDSGTVTAKFLKNSITNITEIMDLFIEQDPDDMQSCKAKWDVVQMIYYKEEIIDQNKRKRRDC
ncbi:Kynurenine 3-monooxygenase [Trichinella spiralis]|uniref:Kynurenine 3-monooxygenase n=1 Tax=Trichinella spiralis TaxID=6334 RepID=A0ABR3KRX7_TRISP